MVVLGLGSNQGNREQHLQQAVDLLKAIIFEIHCSSVYESKALLPDDAPLEWDIPFLNMAIKGKTDLAPDALLQKIKHIEKALGRETRGHWGPREIDIDILAYEDVILNQTDLVIPHNELRSRDFALIPFADIHPLWKYPNAGESYGKTIIELSRLVHSALRKTSIIIQ